MFIRNVETKNKDIKEKNLRLTSHHKMNKTLTKKIEQRLDSQ